MNSKVGSALLNPPQRVERGRVRQQRLRLGENGEGDEELDVEGIGIGRKCSGRDLASAVYRLSEPVDAKGVHG